MVEVSEIGLKEDELELELGLSIGGGFRKLSETPKPAERESGVLFPLDSKICNGFHSDLEENQTTTTTTTKTTKTSRSNCGSPTTAFETESEVLDPKTKRQVHALRRQEVKKKQKEKRCRGRNNIHASEFRPSVQLEDQIQQRASKREKMEISTSPNVGTENVFNNDAGNGNGNPNYSDGQTVHYLAVGAVQYPFASFQVVPYANGFDYPCVVPGWAPPGGGGREKSVFQPVACRGFRPFVVAKPSLGLSLPNGCDSEKSGGKDVEVRKTASYGSPVSSSSTVSDNHNSSSHEGDGSSKTRTPSSHSSPEQNRRDCPKPNDNKGHSSEVQSTCSHQAEPAHSNNIAEDNEEAKPVFESPPLEKLISTTENPSPSSLKDNMGKPPMPQSLNRKTKPPPTALLQMPCVSTRGNGPNGKTIRGFLYRYTNSEVSIVCVCHGSTFSPAEFVQHAGGTDVSHPLKHITVIPSAFG